MFGLVYTFGKEQEIFGLVYTFGKEQENVWSSLYFW